MRTGCCPELIPQRNGLSCLRTGRDGAGCGPGHLPPIPVDPGPVPSQSRPSRPTPLLSRRRYQLRQLPPDHLPPGVDRGAWGDHSRSRSVSNVSQLSQRRPSLRPSLQRVSAKVPDEERRWVAARLPRHGKWERSRWRRTSHIFMGVPRSIGGLSRVRPTPEALRGG